MEKLLASSLPKNWKIQRGEKVTGEIITKTDKELTLDIGAKAEGVLPARDLSDSQKENLKVGDKVEAYVVVPENESGQITLSLYQSNGTQKAGRTDWAKFQSAQNRKSKLQVKVLEINRGGLIVEIGGARGFLPNSQVGFELLSNISASSKTGLETLIGQNINVTVSEIDTSNNRLIFTQRGQVLPAVLEKLKAFKVKQNVKGKIVAILPFGLVVDSGGVEGLVFISDVSWEKVDDLSSKFTVGQEVEAQVLGVDTELGRVNLSIKHLGEDPFTKLAEKYPADEVVKGQISAVSDAGVTVKLSDGVEALLPVSKMESGTNYEVGQSMSFLVDNVDTRRRRVNLAPFVTTTEGLIYK